ncbi:polysaccharide deacetylase family protein [Metabacillus halosaccharovorans]|uniref:polysaccharide deacetylase family protein n=1 Tax=Metabacillus halosaccharovorans TaxID=930124 RepID=UPI001FE836D4|nr:polysaccharide deacetylase family protein [Metabacillus halosaccharovorans]
MKKFHIVFFCLLVMTLTGCAFKKSEPEITAVSPKMEIPQKEKEAKPAITQIATTEKKMALTFNGLSDKETMLNLLEELDRLGIKSTFFLQGMRVAEDPELAKEILARGHTIQNNTLNHVLPNKLNYEEAYVEVALANKIFQEHLNIQPSYIRSRSGDSSQSLEEAAAQLDMQVISNTINPQDSKMQSAEDIAAYIKQFSNRGAIIQLNTYINPEVIRAIKLIYNDAVASGYTLTTFEEVEKGNYLTEEKPSTNHLAVNPDYEESKPTIIHKFSTKDKEIALTFDDWASDEGISKVLDILDTYHIKSTFFLIGTGVEKNPQLAKLIVERGHEVASHSYSHKVVTEMDPLDLQEDIVKNDQVLSYALQEKPVNYFRPTQGILDTKSAKAITATGIDYIIQYDVTSLDWDMSRSDQEIFNRVVDRVEPGSIITMHILDKSHTVTVLPSIIENLQQKGYTFRTISEMITKNIEGGS